MKLPYDFHSLELKDLRWYVLQRTWGDLQIKLFFFNLSGPEIMKYVLGIRDDYRFEGRES